MIEYKSLNDLVYEEIRDRIVSSRYHQQNTGHKFAQNA